MYYSWLACFCLIFGSSVLCDRKLGKRQIESLCSVLATALILYYKINGRFRDLFSCSNGKCIDESLTCDGHTDCSDGSDETQSLCSKLFLKCPGLAFRCDYGACISKNLICDGKNDCVDGSDESTSICRVNSEIAISNSSQNNQYTCSPDEFKCMNGQCIDSTTVCDGYQNCHDESDETAILCEQFSCPKYTFKCRYGACINKLGKCNGVKNCLDGSDEDRCFKKPILKPKPSIVTTTQSNTQATTQSNEKTKCVIPNTEGSIYSYSNQNLSPGSLVDPNQLIEENCKEGYFKVDRYRNMRCIENGQWESYITDKLCLKMCPALTSDNLKFECFSDGIIVDCSRQMRNGTRAIPSCRTTHKLPNGIEPTPTVLICRPDGKWDGQLFKCVPSCGKVYVQHQVLISGGTKASVGTSPWNVGIYENFDRSYNMICGGTLISENVVVSAAHCFERNLVGTDKVIMNNGIYKIGIGKYERDIAIQDNEFTQIIDAFSIYVNRNYFGSYGNYINDIAVIVLPMKIIISNIVLPVCMDWEKKYIVSNGTLGKIVGWGKTETLRPSNTLLEANLPYIDQKSCRNIYKNGFEIFVTADKFCAGSQSGQAVHEGDSGAGLTFVHNNAHYLTGIVSVDDPNTNYSIALFTDVPYHIDWIRKIVLNSTVI